MLRNKVGIYIIIIALALLGLMWMQYNWIIYSIKTQDERFTDKVNSILEEFANEVEESYYCIDLFTTDEFNAGEVLYIMKCMPGKEEKNTNTAWPVLKNNVVDTIENFLWWKYKDLDTIFSYKGFEFDLPGTMRMEMNLH